MICNLVFDFDGTLVDTVDCIWGEYENVMDKMGLAPITHRQFTQNIGKTWEDIITTFWPDIDASEFTSNYDVGAEIAKPFVGVDEALNRLSLDYELAIMTSRGSHSFLQHAKTCSVDLSMFVGVYHKDNLKYNKPDPRALHQVLDELGFDPEQTLYVGDSVVDAECAFDAGCGFVGVLSGGAYVEDFESAGVRHIIENVSKLPALLEDIDDGFTR